MLQVQETLRLYPPAPGVVREASHPIVIDGAFCLFPAQISKESTASSGPPAFRMLLALVWPTGLLSRSPSSSPKARASRSTDSIMCRCPLPQGHSFQGELFNPLAYSLVSEQCNMQGCHIRAVLCKPQLHTLLSEFPRSQAHAGTSRVHLQVSFWTAQRDPSIWKEPLAWVPERFLEGSPEDCGEPGRLAWTAFGAFL